MKHSIAAANVLASSVNVVEMGISAVLTSIAAVAGKMPALLGLFLAAVVIDYITGWVKSKYFLKEWNSKMGFTGIIKKIMYFVMILTSFLIGWTLREIGEDTGIDLDFAMLIGWYVTSVMLVNEFTSILENLYVIMPEMVPTWLIKTLKIADNAMEGRINDIVCKNQNCGDCELKERCNMKKEDNKKDTENSKE